MAKARIPKRKAAKTPKQPTSSLPPAARKSSATPLAGPPGGQAEIKKPTQQAAGWTFLTNHAHVLSVLSAQPEIVLREVAARVGITERAVQRIILDLEEAGIIRREKVGRRNRYEVSTDHALRHPIEAHCSIGDLLKLING